MVTLTEFDREFPLLQFDRFRASVSNPRAVSCGTALTGFIETLPTLQPNVWRPLVLAERITLSASPCLLERLTVCLGDILLLAEFEEVVISTKRKGRVTGFVELKPAPIP
jgi:hypothetical protein